MDHSNRLLVDDRFLPAFPRGFGEDGHRYKPDTPGRCVIHDVAGTLATVEVLLGFPDATLSAELRRQQAIFHGMIAPDPATVSEAAE